jgi:hypothetical protein
MCASFIHVQAIVQRSSALSCLLIQLGELCIDYFCEKNASPRLLLFMHSALKLVNVVCSVYNKEVGIPEIWTSENLRTAKCFPNTNQRSYSGIDMLSLVYLRLSSSSEADSAAKEAPPREWLKGGAATYANTSLTSQGAHSSENSNEEDDGDVVHQMLFWVLCVFSSISAYKQPTFASDSASSIQEKFMTSYHFYEVTQRIGQNLETEDNWTGNATLVPFTR